MEAPQKRKSTRAGSPIGHLQVLGASAQTLSAVDNFLGAAVVSREMAALSAQTLSTVNGFPDAAAASREMTASAASST